MIIDLGSTQEQLASLNDPLIEGHKAAIRMWERLIDESPDMALPFDATARANFIHPHICREVSLRVADLPDVEPNEALDFFALKVGTEILLRFKYVGNGVPHNYRTRRQKLLSRQTYDPGMTIALTGDPALTPPTLLTAGYTLENGKELGRLEIRCDCVHHQSWRYDIFGGAQVVEPIVLAGLEDTTKPATVASRKSRLRLVENEEEAEQK